MKVSEMINHEKVWPTKVLTLSIVSRTFCICMFPPAQKKSTTRARPDG
jgi:hypothetical protein